MESAHRRQETAEQHDEFLETELYLFVHAVLNTQEKATGYSIIY